MRRILTSMVLLVLLFPTLVFTVMFSSTSFAKWKKVVKNVSGNTHYVDFERIRKHDGYVYWWTLSDFLKPTEQGYLSGKVYQQGDCKFFWIKVLSFSSHKEPMGGGTGETVTLKNPRWNYPPPNSSGENILKKACAYAK